MARTFVAVWPPAAVVAALAALPRPAVPGVRWVDPAGLHVTLRFLGDVDPAAVADRLRDGPLPRAEATVGPATSVLGSRIVVARVAGLEKLAALVTDTTADLGRPPPGRPFVGHVTLARTRDDSTARRISGAAVVGSFAVDELAVVASTTHPDGARYHTRATVPLG